MLGIGTLDFGKSNKRLIGIDITSAEVNLIELGRHGKNFRIDSHITRPLNKGAMVERRIHHLDEVAETIRIAYDQAEPNTRRAVVAVPASAAIIKTLTMPAWLSDDEIEARIQSESDKHISFPFNEVAFDYQRLGTSTHSSNQQDVLLVACRQQYVDQLVEVITKAGLAPVAVDVETLAIERVIGSVHPSLATLSSEHSAAALIVMEAEMMAFHVVKGDRVVYSRDTFFAGHSPMDKLRNRYGQNLEEVGPLASHHAAVPSTLVETLLQHIGRSLQLYYTTGRPAEIQRLLLAGSACRTSGLIERLMSDTGMAVDVIDPLEGMSISPRIGTRQALIKSAPAMLVACGLAMRETYGN